MRPIRLRSGVDEEKHLIGVDSRWSIPRAGSTPPELEESARPRASVATYQASVARRRARFRSNRACWGARTRPPSGNARLQRDRIYAPHKGVQFDIPPSSSGIPRNRV
jgi:hypothetical protein